MASPGPAKGEGGRPTSEFNWDRLESLCQRAMNLADCSEIMQLSESTIQRRIREEYDLTFEAYKDKKMALTRLNLVEMALDRVKAGNITMHIFLLKNMCRMADKVETVSETKLGREFIINKLNGDQEILKAE
jgi:hypothetical protein